MPSIVGWIISILIVGGITAWIGLSIYQKITDIKKKRQEREETKKKENQK